MQLVDLKDQIIDLSGRELDILIAKYVFGFEPVIERSGSKLNPIRVLYQPKKKRKYARHFSRAKSNREKVDSSFRPLPRYSNDIRDMQLVVKKVNKPFAVEFQGNSLYNAYGDFISFQGSTMSTAVCKLLLYFTLKERL